VTFMHAQTHRKAILNNYFSLWTWIIGILLLLIYWQVTGVPVVVAVLCLLTAVESENEHRPDFRTIMILYRYLPVMIHAIFVQCHQCTPLYVGDDVRKCENNRLNLPRGRLFGNWIPESHKRVLAYYFFRLL